MTPMEWAAVAVAAVVAYLMGSGTTFRLIRKPEPEPFGEHVDRCERCQVMPVQMRALLGGCREYRAAYDAHFNSQMWSAFWPLYLAWRFAYMVGTAVYLPGRSVFRLFAGKEPVA